LKEIFNYALNTGVIPDSWRKSIITLILKKEEALHDIGNWRPISLINADAKIFTKIMANRLNPLCGEVIGEHQQGLVKGRSIVDAALNIISTMRSNKNQETPDWLVFLDQKKAFDRLNYKYLIKVLRNMKFDLKFITLVENLFTDLTAHIYDASFLSVPFKIERGVRQRDPSRHYYIY